MGSQKRLETAYGEVLRKARRKAGLSQEQLALIADLDRTYVSLLERGLRQPTLKTLFALAGALGTSPGKMIEAVGRELARQPG